MTPQSNSPSTPASVSRLMLLYRVKTWHRLMMTKTCPAILQCAETLPTALTREQSPSLPRFFSLSASWTSPWTKGATTAFTLLPKEPTTKTDWTPAFRVSWVLERQCQMERKASIKFNQRFREKTAKSLLRTWTRGSPQQPYKAATSRRRTKGASR